MVILADRADVTDHCDLAAQFGKCRMAALNQLVGRAHAHIYRGEPLRWRWLLSRSPAVASLSWPPDGERAKAVNLLTSRSRSSTQSSGASPQRAGRCR